MTHRPRILVIGEALATFMSYADDDPLKFHGPMPSGAPVIFASAAARLGMDVVLGTGLGNDMFGDMFRERFGRDGISGLGLITDPTHPTSGAFVRYDTSGSRRFVFYIQGTASQEVDDGLLDRVGHLDWLHVSGATLAFGGQTGETLWRAVERAVASGTPISFDPNIRSPDMSDPLRQRMDRLLEVAAVILVSAGELETLGGSEAHILARGGTICHKAGAAGARVLVGDDAQDIRAPIVTEVDPDGAGDVFAAGFVAATLSGADAAKSTAVGVAVASASVTVRGPLASRIDHVLTYLAALEK
jgi:sugar/nucleoside kinase (ribokinase family)